MNYISEETFEKIYKLGHYYNPANRHYNSQGTVNCDKCAKTNLNVSIGWEKYDLCLQCISEMSNQIKFKEIPTSPYTPFAPFAPFAPPPPSFAKFTPSPNVGFREMRDVSVQSTKDTDNESF